MTRRMFDIDKLLHPQDHRHSRPRPRGLKGGARWRQIATALRLSPTATRELLAEPMPRSPTVELEFKVAGRRGRPPKVEP